MEVSFACDDCAECAQALDEPGIEGSDAMAIAIEVDAATGGGAGEIEAIFD